MPSIGQSCCFDDRHQALVTIDIVQMTDVKGLITGTVVPTIGAGDPVIRDIALVMVTRVIVSTIGFGDPITRPLVPLVE